MSDVRQAPPRRSPVPGLAGAAARAGSGAGCGWRLRRGCRRAWRGRSATCCRGGGVLLDDLTGDLADLEAAIARHRSASALLRLAGVAAGVSGMMVLTLIKTGDRRGGGGGGRTGGGAWLLGRGA